MSAAQVSLCCLGHCFSNMPKADFWGNGNSIYDTLRTGTVTKDKNAWSLCWYYYRRNYVTTRCTRFTEATNAASEFLPVLAHTSIHIPLFNPIRKLLLEEIVGGKIKKDKSQCQAKEKKVFISDHWHIGNKNHIVKLRNYEVVYVFIFRLLGIWENS